MSFKDVTRCEAVIGSEYGLTQCKFKAESLRDGRRVCTKHMTSKDPLFVKPGTNKVVTRQLVQLRRENYLDPAVGPNSPSPQYPEVEIEVKPDAPDLDDTKLKLKTFDIDDSAADAREYQIKWAAEREKLLQFLKSL